MDNQLLELDMNISFKLIWGRHLVWNIEDNNLMEDTLQFGARPNRRDGRPTPRIGNENYL